MYFGSIWGIWLNSEPSSAKAKKKGQNFPNMSSRSSQKTVEELCSAQTQILQVTYPSWALWFIQVFVFMRSRGNRFLQKFVFVKKEKNVLRVLQAKDEVVELRSRAIQAEETVENLEEEVFGLTKNIVESVVFSFFVEKGCLAFAGILTAWMNWGRDSLLFDQTFCR